ncbi:MAG: cyclopropane-fatty-acyl-phospholipid synthase family protein [Cytophagaceae bacterium]|nr:cyclopropane-fatty-acyl-phospholipid synthase family protein [Cytophagaceae bacterium]
MSLTLSLIKPYSLYENIILAIFSKMEHGSLKLTLPTGEKIQFGNGNGQVEANMRIRNNNFFKKCVLYGDVGFGESYVDGDWETDSIKNVITWFIINMDTNPAISGTKKGFTLTNLFKYFNRAAHLTRNNSLTGSRKNISEHYDLSNDFFRLFLDETMTYSLGIFSSPETSLKDSQIEKYDRICRTLKIKASDHILEIGSGWGGFAIHCAKKYSCKITTVTISEEQYNYASQKFREEGLEKQIEIRLMDYRKIEGSYDKIVSIEMLEAVGHKYLPEYFKKCHELLNKNGSLALQVITCPDCRYDELRKGIDFIQKHIFPGSLLPSVGKINQCINQTSDLTLHDIKDIGLHYATTLRLWFEKFNRQLDQVKALGMDEKFIRKWNYYLQYCEAAFKTRNISVMQIVYTRPNNFMI